MENATEKELPEITFIKSNIVTLFETKDNDWVFTGKPHNKQHIDEINGDIIIDKLSIRNLINLNDIELNKLLQNLSFNLDKNENIYLDYPYNSIGIIDINYSDQTSEILIGTLIIPGVVITCANALFKEDKEISKIKFLCNYDEIQCNFKYETDVIDYFYPKEYLEGYPLEDYAILILKNLIGKDTGYLGILPFNNIENSAKFNFCLFDYIKDENLINFLEEKNIKKNEFLEMKAKQNIENIQNTENNMFKYDSPYNNRNKNLGYYKNSVSENFFNFCNKCINSRKYIKPEIFEGTIKLRENTILHKHKLFNEIPGSPIFIEKDNLAFWSEYQQLIKEQEEIKDYFDNILKEDPNQTSTLKRSMPGIRDNNYSYNQNKKDLINKNISLEKPEYYLVGICTGKSDGIFYKGTFICKKRFEKIKDWIHKYIKKNGKVNKHKLLNLESNYLDDYFLENIAKVDLCDLTHFLIRNNSIKFNGVCSLAEGNFKYLIELDLSNNDIRENGVKVICRSKIFENLEILKLASNNIGKLGPLYFANSIIKNLRHLDLSNNDIKADGVTNLFSGKKNNFEYLEYLNLSNNKILNQGIINLANSKEDFIKNIKYLKLSSNMISNEGIINFSKSNKFYKLLFLDLSQNNIIQEGIQELCNANFGYVKELNLSHNKIGDEGSSYLAVGKLFSLQNLILDNCDISDIGSFYISNGLFPCLENLNLRNNKITDKGAQFLIDNDFPFLRNLYLQENKIGSDGRISLSKLKNINVHFEQI